MYFSVIDNRVYINRVPNDGEIGGEIDPAKLIFGVDGDLYEYDGATLVPKTDDMQRLIHLQRFKEDHKRKVNWSCEQHILKKYPIYEQLNNLHGHYGEDARIACSTFILNCRRESNRVWESIDQAINEGEVIVAFDNMVYPEA